VSRSGGEVVSGYGERREPGRCNDNGKNPVLACTVAALELGHDEPAAAEPAGQDARADRRAFGLHERLRRLRHGRESPRVGRRCERTFYGGYYQDVSSKGHGEGCGYLTTAHEARYHDYSTDSGAAPTFAGGPSAEALAPPAQPRSTATPIQALSCWPTCRWTHYDLTMLKPGRVEGLKFVHTNAPSRGSESARGLVSHARWSASATSGWSPSRRSISRRTGCSCRASTTWPSREPHRLVSRRRSSVSGSIPRRASLASQGAPLRRPRRGHRPLVLDARPREAAHPPRAPPTCSAASPRRTQRIDWTATVRSLTR